MWLVLHCLQLQTKFTKSVTHKLHRQLKWFSRSESILNFWKLSLKIQLLNIVTVICE